MNEVTTGQLSIEGMEPEQTSIEGSAVKEEVTQKSKVRRVPGLRRETYKRIKHYSKAELESYLRLVYQNGANDALGMFLGGMNIILDKVPDMTPEYKQKILETINEELGPKNEMPVAEEE